MDDAFDRTAVSFVYAMWFTPKTSDGASAEGMEMMTFFAPPPECKLALSIVVTMPVAPQTMSALNSSQGTTLGHMLGHLALPSTMRLFPALSALSSSELISFVPSYLKRCTASYTSLEGSLTTVTSASELVAQPMALTKR